MGIKVVKFARIFERFGIVNHNQRVLKNLAVLNGTVELSVIAADTAYVCRAVFGLEAVGNSVSIACDNRFAVKLSFDYTVFAGKVVAFAVSRNVLRMLPRIRTEHHGF